MPGSAISRSSPPSSDQVVRRPLAWRSELTSSRPSAMAASTMVSRDSGTTSCGSGVVVRTFGLTGLPSLTSKRTIRPNGAPASVRKYSRSSRPSMKCQPAANPLTSVDRWIRNRRSARKIDDMDFGVIAGAPIAADHQLPGVGRHLHLEDDLRCVGPVIDEAIGGLRIADPVVPDLAEVLFLVWRHRARLWIARVEEPIAPPRDRRELHPQQPIAERPRRPRRHGSAVPERRCRAATAHRRRERRCRPARTP